MAHTAAAAARVAETYYDSTEADAFYSSIWGGEDIHIGLYPSPDEPIASASRRTVQEMAARLLPLTPASTVVDIGAGYGGAARYLASEHGCRVLCVNVSETQNARNRQHNADAGLSDRVQVLHASFEDLPLPDGSCDVVWSQDAILHSGDRQRVLAEVHRVLRPGGSFIFTDPMQSDSCPNGVLGPVLARLELSSLGSFAFYRAALGELGFQEVEIRDLTEHLVQHYSRVRQELRVAARLRERSAAYVERMIEGLCHWVEAGRHGHLAWGILHFRR
jgi:sarcosine/dimethylglycine N-methyltransferase